MSTATVHVYTQKEEVFNSITHGIGILFSITCLTLLVTLSSIYGNMWSIISSCVFGFSMMMMYTASTVYHAAVPSETKKVLKCEIQMQRGDWCWQIVWVLLVI